MYLTIIGTAIDHGEGIVATHFLLSLSYVGTFLLFISFYIPSHLLTSHPLIPNYLSIFTMVIGCSCGRIRLGEHPL